jgi:hypothetical protein
MLKVDTLIKEGSSYSKLRKKFHRFLINNKNAKSSSENCINS